MWKNAPAMRHEGRRHEYGFTLIEVLVVVAIFVLTLTLTLSSMSGSIKNITLRTETKKFSASLRFTKNLAVTHGASFIFEVGQDGKSYRIQPRSESESRTINIRGKIGQRLMAGVTLPSSIFIQVEEEDEDWAEYANQPDFANKILFYPKGNSSGKTFSINHTKGRRYIVEIAPITGRITIEGPFGQYN